jgi:hypothetical protein
MKRLMAWVFIATSTVACDAMFRQYSVTEGCVVDDDCILSEGYYCVGGACVECRNDSDCDSFFSDGQFCDSRSAYVCVECFKNSQCIEIYGLGWGCRVTNDGLNSCEPN